MEQPLEILMDQVPKHDLENMAREAGFLGVPGTFKYAVNELLQYAMNVFASGVVGAVIGSIADEILDFNNPTLMYVGIFLGSLNGIQSYFTGLQNNKEQQETVHVSDRPINERLTDFRNALHDYSGF